MNHLRAEVIRRIALVGFLLVLAAALVSGRNLALAAPGVEQGLLCRVDVAKLGFPQPPYSGAELKVLLSPFKIDFQDDSTLVISWVTADEPLPHLPKRKKFSRLPVVPAHLHLLFVDAIKGTELREKDLSVPSAPTSVFVNHSGNLIVRAGHSVKLYSADFVVMNEAKLPLPIDLSTVNSNSNAIISPDGRHLVLCSAQGSTATLDLLDADSLRSLGRVSEGQRTCPRQISDTHFLAPTGELEPLIPPKTGEAASPASPEPDLQHHFPPAKQLGSGDAVVVFRGIYMEFRSGDGKLLQSDTLPKRHPFEPVGAVARNRERLAVVVARMRGLTIPSLDMYAFPSAEEAAVYDIRTAKRVFTVGVKGPSPWPTASRAFYMRFTLSPNGSLLAILSNGSVSVYQLP